MPVCATPNSPPWPGIRLGYSYAYLAFGELIAFVIGWDLILEYALQAATVSAGWSGYFNKLLEASACTCRSS